MAMLTPGSRLGGCRIDAIVGRGGMGVVYRARQLGLDRDVAVKVIAPELVDDPLTRERFVGEARAAGAVEHPNIVPVHAVGVDHEHAFLVMRYVAGEDLRALVQRDGPLAPEAADEICAQLGAALDAIHAAGYVHRDVKPRNVMVEADGHVYLTDFGLAKAALAASGPTSAEHWVGTLDFVAPEQIRGRPVDARTDVYALGGVLFFMLTGRVPFERPTDEAKLWAQLHQPAPLPSAARPGLPPALDTVVRRALAKDPQLRQPTAGALAAAAHDAVLGRAEAATAAAATPHRRRAPRGGLPAWGAALALVAAGGAVWLAIRRRAPHRPGASGRSRGAANATAAGATTVAGAGTRDGGGERYRRRRRPLPARVAVAGGRVWVLSIHEERIARFDPRTLRRRGRQPHVGRGASGIAADGTRVWVVKRTTGTVLALDARDGHVVHRFSTPLPPVRVAAGAAGLWIVMREDELGPAVVRHYDRAGVTLLHELPFEEGVRALATGGGAAWIALAGRDRVLQLDPDGRVRHGAWLPDGVTALTFGAGRLWASMGDGDAIARINPRTARKVDHRGAARSGRPGGRRRTPLRDEQHPAPRGGARPRPAGAAAAGRAARAAQPVRHGRGRRPRLGDRDGPGHADENRVLTVGSHASSPAELAERLEAERRGTPFLVLRDDAGRQRIVPLTGTLSVGRQPSSDLALAWDDQVSRAHAAIERIGDVWTVVDDGRSRNGTFVNGERLHGRRSLRDGDVLGFGRTRITFAAPAPGEYSTRTGINGAAPDLSPAQRRVLVALCRPFARTRFATPPSNRDLAAELVVSVETVKFHLHALFALFGLEEVPQRQKRARLAQQALEAGVVRPHELREG